jgi:Na+-driven multidrug efflux pump
MLGDGAAAYLSLCQGKKDVKSGNKSMGNVVMLLVVSGVIMAVLFAAFNSQILTAFGATKNNLPYANEYFDYIILGIPFFVVGNGLNSIIRADGSPKFAMITTLVGCIINVILDPIAIFALHMGMMGAAIATIAGQIVTAICGIVYILFRAKTFKLAWNNMIPNMAVIDNFVPLGISSFLTQISIVVIMGVMKLLRDFVLSVPLAIVLPMLFGVEGVLFSAPVADIVTSVAVVLTARSVIKELDSKSTVVETAAEKAQAA